MAQDAILIDAHDSAHAPEATPEDLEPCDTHSDELAATGSMLAAYALTPRDMATSVRADAPGSAAPTRRPAPTGGRWC
jgi:hypothetical protein